jgi:zinc transport system substrate-binding protein
MRHVLRAAAGSLVLAGVAVSSAMGEATPERGADAGVAVRAVVSIPPLKALVEPLVAAVAPAGAPGPSVDMLIPPGVSEHGYEIPPATLAALARADVVVHVGLGLEPQVTDFLKDHPSPQRRVVEFAKVAGVEEHDHHDHAHDAHDHDHDHANCGDPHLWLDPVLVSTLVPAVRKAVEEAAAAKSPGGVLESGVRQRLDAAERALAARVRAVDEEHRTRLAPFKGRSIIVAHDAWRQLATRYGFSTVAIKGMLATEPTPQSIKAAVDAIRAQPGSGAKVVFTEPQLARGTSQRVADAAGAKLMEIDPLGAGDWFSTMRANLDNIVAALSTQQAGTEPAAKPTR